MAAIKMPTPHPTTNLATMSIAALTAAAHRMAPTMTITAPNWIVYFRENRSADQELKSAPRAAPAELTPGRITLEFAPESK